MIRNSALAFAFLLAGAPCFAQTPVPAYPVPAYPVNPASRPGPATTQNSSPNSWYMVYGHCREAVRTMNVRAEVELCRQAVQLADKEGDATPRQQIDQLQSYETYGQALLALGQGPQALAAEDKAVAIAGAHLHPSDQEYAMPFYWRALVEAHFHDGPRASADLSLVEDSYRKVIDASSPTMRHLYNGYLARILRQHAALLDAMGKSKDAQTLRDEAAKL